MPKLDFDIGCLLEGTEVANFQLPDPELMQMYTDLQRNHIWLDTEVSYEHCEFLIKWLLAADRDNTTKPIYIHIMSGGGDLDIMFTLYEIIKNLHRPVVTINEGRCHSAAFIIFLAGDTRLMRRYAQFIAHEGSAGMGGSYKEVKQATEAYKRNVDVMRTIIQDETHITKEQLKEHFDVEQDWYIDYTQARELGILKETTYDLFACGGVGSPKLLKVGEAPLTLPGYAEI